MQKAQAFEQARKAALLSVWTLLGIGIAEITISQLTSSLTLVADGVDSMADALISFIVWFGIKMLYKPRSRTFPFGYAKIESFAAFIAAVIIVILGSFILYYAYERILHPVEVTNPIVTMATLFGAGSVSLYRAFRVNSVAKTYNMISLNLDAKNSIKDGSASFIGFGSILAGFFLGILYMDAIGSIIIAGYIFYMAYTAFKESTFVLLDALEEPELKQQISKFIEEKFRYENVKVEDVFLRPLGPTSSARIHIVLDGNMTLNQAHPLLTRIRKDISSKFQLEDTVVIPRPAR